MATKLVVRDLPTEADEAQLRVLFEKFGNVSRVGVTSTTAPREAMIEMYDAGDAQKAMSYLNNRLFLDSKIHVTQALLGTRF